LAVQPTLQSLHQKSVNCEMTVANMCLRIQIFRNPEYSINVYVMNQVPSALKYTLKSNIRLKWKLSNWRFIRRDKRIVTKPVILFEWFCSVLRWSSEGLKLLYTFEGEELLKKDTEHHRKKGENQHFCFQLPTYCQEASIYCF